MKLLVRNLAAATTEEKLISLFSEFGKVQSCSLVLDSKTGKSKGFGFVEMPKVGDAKAAMKKLNGFKLAGNILRVKKSEAKSVDAEAEKAPVEKKAKSVQFAQTPKAEKPAEKTTIEASEEVIDNDNNAANLYGQVKQPDDY